MARSPRQQQFQAAVAAVLGHVRDRHSKALVEEIVQHSGDAAPSAWLARVFELLGEVRVVARVCYLVGSMGACVHQAHAARPHAGMMRGGGAWRRRGGRAGVTHAPINVTCSAAPQIEATTQQAREEDGISSFSGPQFQRHGDSSVYSALAHGGYDVSVEDEDDDTVAASSGRNRSKSTGASIAGPSRGRTGSLVTGASAGRW
jgi:hypothetical protein